MKKLIPICLICVVFCFSLNVGSTYCFEPVHLEFVFGDKIFSFSPELDTNCSWYNITPENIKLNRFGNKEERIELLNKLLSIGFDKEIALEYIFPGLNKRIDTIAKNINVAPQNASITKNSNLEKVFQIKKEVVGVKLNKMQLLDNICSAYLTNNNLIFELPTEKTTPSITANELKKSTNLRADFSTSIASSSPDRKHNIKNASNSLNGFEILPNQIFSFNNIVGRRTVDNGYRQAKIIVNDEFVDGVGGGVCQVSSTLYNSALLAGLEIIEANKHSKQVGYVNFGFDAMVNFGSSDLKFRNNTNEKITIITNFSSSTLRIRLFGEALNNTYYKLKNEILNSVEPNEEILIDEHGKYIEKIMYDDEFFYLQKGSRGMEIKTYREKYINNVLVTTELLRHDKFKVKNSIKVYGSIKRNVV